MAQFAVVALVLFYSVGMLQGAAACSFNPSKNCAQPVNTGCDQCKLYEVATGPTCKKPDPALCRVVGSNTIQISSGEAGHTSHWKVVPTTAIKGLEDIGSGNAGTYDQLWKDGSDAFAKRDLPSFKTGFYPGYFVNSPSTRTQNQLHVHIAPLKSSNQLYTDLGIKQPAGYGSQWTQYKTSAATGGKTVFMQCPKKGARLEPFTQFVNGLSTFRTAIANPKQDASILVFTPSWCTGSGNPCDFCEFVMYHVGDKDVLDY